MHQAFWQGKVVFLHIAPAAGASMASVPEVRALAGRGLEGDRYFNQTGTYAKKPGPDRHVTLMAMEAIEAFERDFGARLNAGDARRNIVTRQVPLNDLVGREFRVGEVLLRGIRLCEPCDYLARLTGQKVVPGLVHRGGLRAEILTDGIIRVGDVVREA